jgi:hypothetical protein
MHQTSNTIPEIFCWVMECDLVENGSAPEKGIERTIPSQNMILFHWKSGIVRGAQRGDSISSIKFRSAFWLFC